jgi:uncharacterized protein
MTESRQFTDRYDVVDTIELPQPGTIRRGHLRSSLPALQDWSWAFTVVRGASDGPRLALLSGVHPTEYPAMEANIRLTQQLDPSQLRGTIVSIPVVNVPAFLERTPFVCPIDQKNPNRAFPGDPDGTFTDVLTHFIFQSVIAPSDALIDLHGGDMVEDLTPFSIFSVTGNATTDQASEALGRAFGLPYLIAHRAQPGGLGGTTVQAAAEAGIPGIVPESGGRGLVSNDDTQALVDGVERSLRHLGMLPGGPPVEKPVTIINSFTWLTSPAEGMWYPAVQAGNQVTAGQVIGEVLDLFGEPRGEISTPHDGVVLFVTSNPAMRENGLVMAIGSP